MRNLVVEDEVRLARHVSRALSTAGHDAVVLHDGETALGEAKQTRYDLIVLDIMLPGVDFLPGARRRARRRKRPRPEHRAGSSLAPTAGESHLLRSDATWTELNVRLPQAAGWIVSLFQYLRKLRLLKFALEPVKHNSACTPIQA
jgi:CheY-like chemotaxis protein